MMFCLDIVQRVVDIKNRPRIPIPDEDPYSVAGNGGGSSGSSGFGNGNPNGVLGAGGIVAATREQLLMQSQQHAQRRSEKPPKLPPRENLYPHDIPKVMQYFFAIIMFCIFCLWYTEFLFLVLNALK